MTLLSIVMAGGKKEVSTVPVKFFIFREDCFEKFLKYDISDMDCLKFTISKGLGLGIVAGSSILKLPQIIKIVSSGSVEGLAAISQYIEVS
jgi:mannose-P-dolichol utilization defect protein 1